MQLGRGSCSTRVRQPPPSLRHIDLQALRQLERARVTSAATRSPRLVRSIAFLPTGRSPLTRPELALCLLSELGYEHDEELRRHLPALLQTITLNAGAPFPPPCSLPP